MEEEPPTDAVEEVTTEVLSTTDDNMLGDEMSGEELEEEFEKSDSITGMSAAEKKKHRMEYLQLLKEIEGQNRIVEQLKDQLITMCESPCLTKCELKEIKKLRGCMENENLKLQCMVQRAMQMQNENPSRCWDEVPIVPTLEDDVFPRMANTVVMEALGLIPGEKKKKERDTCNVCSKSTKKKTQPCESGGEVDSDTYKLFEEMALKDEMINCLNDKLKMLEQEKTCQGKQQRKPERPKQPCRSEQNIEGDISQMQCTVEKLKAELKCLCKEKQQYENQRREKSPKELRKLKKDYAELLCKLQKRNEQYNELESRVKGYCASGAGGGGGANGGGGKSENVDKAELKLLREKVNDLRDEQDEYTCIIKEQAEQIDEYRRKYIDAQQKVEEQKCMLEKIDMNNKRIEGQIEAEVKRIKAKFKEQLSELSQYPKLLENEQVKLASACKDRDELEKKLRLVCKELKSIKDQMAVKEDKPDCSQKLARCEGEMLLLQQQLDELLSEKEAVCDELVKAKLDLDTMRAESAKIITNTKERFEANKNNMSMRIDALEKELAQCRASAFLSITDREAVIKEMQSQLSTLSYSFDSAQKQIKTLKNHITFLSNDNCIPIKC